MPLVQFSCSGNLGTSGVSEPAALILPNGDRKSKARGDIGSGEHVRNWSNGDHFAAAQEKRMGGGSGKLFKMMGNGDCGKLRLCSGQRGYGIEQRFPSRKIKSGRRLVKQKQ